MAGERQSKRPDVGAMRVMAEAGHELIPLHRWDAVRTEPDGTEKRLGKVPSRSAWTSSPDATERALAEAEADGINLGVRLDDETLVVDVDRRNFADGVDSLQRLSEAVGVDLYNWTPKTETGGGGLHLWMRKPPDLRLRAGLSAEYPGIYFKTRGGQVVAPGSIHPDTGRQYVLDDFLGECQRRQSDRYALVFRPVKCQSSGKPCIRATMGTVSRGIPTKSGSGASSATVLPLTPSVSHARRALVGPRSGPPCFLEPPTMVGAISSARSRHAFAPGHPLAAIMS